MGRGTKNFRDGETTIGGEVTSVTRTLGDAVLRNALPSSALVGGLDLNHSWSHHQWAVDANIARSQVSGSASAISLIQQSSARYFQRPDAVRDRLDSTRTSLEGYDTQLAFSRLTGHWVGSVALQDVAPGFETNDLGRLRDAGRRSLSLDLHYQEYTPGAHFQRYIIWPFTQQVWNYDGQLVANKYNLYLFGEWRNRWATGIEYDYYAPVADDRLTRGGPLARAPASHHFYYEVRSPSSNRVSVSSSTNMVVTEAGGQAVTMTNSVIWQARSNLRLELDPTIATTRDPAQYVTAYPDARATQTFARRTVFATLHQPMVELDGHADWVLSPRLTLQAYVQQPSSRAGSRSTRRLPSRGRIHSTCTVATSVPPPPTRPARPCSTPTAPDRRHPRTSGSPISASARRDSMRCCAGSSGRGRAWYVVWQHTRGGTSPTGAFDFWRDISRAVGGRPDNVLALKVSYWFAR